MDTEEALSSRKRTSVSYSLPRRRARWTAVEREKIRIDSRADDLRIAAEIGQAQYNAILPRIIA
jgi:hypothetical protein